MMNGGGGDTPAKPPVDMNTWLGYKQKYGTKYGTVNGGNPLDKRMDWVEWTRKALPTGQTPAALARKHAEAMGLNPGDLMASAFEEGMGLRWKDADGSLSDAYYDANQNGELKGYGVDAFRPYGLDQLGGRVDEFIQKGYLPKEFKQKMKGYRAANEVDEKTWAKQNMAKLQQNGFLPKDFKFDYEKNMGDVYDAADAYGQKTGQNLYGSMKRSAYTAALTDDDAAFQAKAAFMRAEKDSFSNYTKKKGVKLTPEEERFFTMAAYNGGPGAAQSMLDYYQKNKMLGQNQFMKNRSGVWGTTWDHIIPRMAGSDMFTSEGFYKKGGSKLPKAAVGMEQPWDGYVQAARGYIDQSLAEQGMKRNFQFTGEEPAVKTPFGVRINKGANTVNSAALNLQEGVVDTMANPMSAANLIQFGAGMINSLTDKKREKELAAWQRQQMMADNIFPVAPGGDRGDYVMSGTAYGQFRPDQMGAKSSEGMYHGKYYADGGPFIPEISQGLLTNEGPIQPFLDPELIPQFSATMPAPTVEMAAEAPVPVEGGKKGKGGGGEADKDLRQAIIQKESEGNYKALPRKKDGSLASSAVGAYQFLWNSHKDDIIRVTGVHSKEEFRNNPKAQDAYFDYWDQAVLTPWAQKIKKELGAKASLKEIKTKIHFAGPKGAYDYFRTGKQTVDAFGTTTGTYAEGGEAGPGPKSKRWVKEVEQNTSWRLQGIDRMQNDQLQKVYKEAELMRRRKSPIDSSRDEDYNEYARNYYYQQVLGEVNRRKMAPPSVSFMDTFGFAEGGTYELTQDQIQQILRQGGQVEFIS